MNAISKTILPLLLLCGGAALQGQQPPENAPPPGAHRMRPPEKFTNLQVLPADISPDRLLSIMNHFAGQLGVHCSFCHEMDPATHRPQFASDAKPEKQTARLMMRMTENINDKFLKQLPTPPKPEEAVSCYTCHRGHSIPETEPLPPPAP